MRTLHTLLLALTLAAAACRNTRPDDAFEPNDTLAEATPLTVGEAVVARANQGDPDVFVVQVPADRRLHVRVESLGLEECAGFRLQGPGGELLYHLPEGCDFGRTPKVQAGGVTGTHTKELLELELTPTVAGAYAFTVLEGAQADNLFDFSWDYRLTVDLR